MGCRLSVGTGGNFDGVRVVHISGYVQDFSGPVTVREVIGKRSKLVCFSPSQLLSQSARPHGLDEQLEPGKLYFLLPHTVFHSGASAIDLATLATRLTAVARGGVVVTRKLSSSGDGDGDGDGGSTGFPSRPRQNRRPPSGTRSCSGGRSRGPGHGGRPWTRSRRDRRSGQRGV
ncbi:unnamed protein product [Spirodela intermedia]|uniref:Uncharacterized protein n=1 Tax=Spirodela intermedia TaxID=51605 RepID=A0A7I8JPW1_SPIIN|nr:unnamed protein product [Spirodela intermedia]CAA6672160.1 unnamed protein product [Spirodela intermedia]